MRRLSGRTRTLKGSPARLTNGARRSPFTNTSKQRRISRHLGWCFTPTTTFLRFASACSSASAFITCVQLSIIARTLKPHSKCGGLAFPLFADQAEWAEKADKTLKGIPPAAKEIIRHLQPWEDTKSPNPLTILNKLSNVDKHRACNFTLAYSRNTNFVIQCDDGTVVTYSPEEPLYLGDVHTVNLPIDKQLVENGARVLSSGTFVLTFLEESDWDDIPVMAVLQDCFDHIEKKVFGPLKPFFEQKAV
jgi:hypothetical protein